MSTPGIDASFQTLGEIVDDLDQSFQGYFFPGLFVDLRKNVGKGFGHAKGALALPARSIFVASET